MWSSSAWDSLNARACGDAVVGVSGLGTSETRWRPRPVAWGVSAASSLLFSSTGGDVGALFFLRMLSVIGFTLRALARVDAMLLPLFWLPNCDGRTESLDEGILMRIGRALLVDAPESCRSRSIVGVGVLAPAAPIDGESIGVVVLLLPDLTDTMAGLPRTMVCAGIGLTTALSR